MQKLLLQTIWKLSTTEVKKGVEFFLDTRVQETSYYNVNYTLKNPECENYDFMLYKQAGIPQYDMEINIEDKTIHTLEEKKISFLKKEMK